MSVLNNWLRWLQYTIISLLLTLAAGAVFPGITLFLHNLLGYQEDKAAGLGHVYVGLISVYAVTVLMKRAKRRLEPKGKAVLITGCDSGFGLVLAKHLDDLGMHVFAGCYLKDKRGDGSVSLEKGCSKRVKVVQLDVTSQESVDNVIKFIRKNLPKDVEFWGVVNNAGSSAFGEIEWSSIDLFKSVAEVNLYGAIRVTKACLPLIRRSKGRVVFMASGLSRITSPSRAVYCTSKYGIQCFARVLNYEMQRWGVKVSLLEPGNYISGTNIFTRTAVAEMGEKLWKSMPKDVKLDYGREYFDKKVLVMHSYCNSGKSDIMPVIKAYESALLQTNPKFTYNPMDAYWLVRLFLQTKLPDCIGDYFYIPKDLPAPPLGKLPS